LGRTEKPNDGLKTGPRKEENTLDAKTIPEKTPRMRGTLKGYPKWTKGNFIRRGIMGKLVGKKELNKGLLPSSN